MSSPSAPPKTSPSAGGAHGSARLRVAVVGSGAVGWSVLETLLEGDVPMDITLIDIGRAIAPEPELADTDPETIREFYDALYGELWRDGKRGFPPPKTHFNELIAKGKAGAKHRIFKSETLGGLSNYWGATMLPLTSNDMQGWPFGPDEMESSYRWVADRVGLSAADDPLNEYFGQTFANRPPITPLPMMARLDEVVNRHGDNAAGDFRVVSGLNRIGMETRDDEPNSCVNCGECMAGCFRGSVFSSRYRVQRAIDDGRITLVRGKVKSLDMEARRLTLETDNGAITTDAFDRVMLCAGCPGTTEVMMRTLGITDGPVMTDNAVYVFPIVYVGGRTAKAERDRYLSQCNLIFACLGRTPGHQFAQAQVYPNFDYLWRYNIPPALWPVFRPLLKAARPRVYWARLYVHSDYSQRYAMSMDGVGKVSFEADESAISPDTVRGIMKSLRSAVEHEGFWVPPVPPVRQKTNSHYGGTLAYNGTLMEMPADNQVAPGVFVCDSTCFPDSPAVSPTFGMMANGARIARSVLAEAGGARVRLMEEL